MLLYWICACLSERSCDDFPPASVLCGAHHMVTSHLLSDFFFFVRQPSWLLQHAARLRLFYTLMMAARCWVHSGGDTHQTRLVRWKLLLKYQQKQTVGLKPPFFPCLFFFLMNGIDLGMIIPRLIRHTSCAWTAAVAASRGRCSVCVCSFMCLTVLTVDLFWPGVQSFALGRMPWTQPGIK